MMTVTRKRERGGRAKPWQKNGGAKPWRKKAPSIVEEFGSRIPEGDHQGLGGKLGV